MPARACRHRTGRTRPERLLRPAAPFRWEQLCPAVTLLHDAAAPPTWVLKHTHARESRGRHAAHALVLMCSRPGPSERATLLPITTREIAIQTTRESRVQRCPKPCQSSQSTRRCGEPEGGPPDMRSVRCASPYSTDVPKAFCSAVQ